MKSEEERILEEVARIKRRAHESGLVTNVFKLYFEDLRFGHDVHPGLRVIAKKDYREGREEIQRVEALVGGTPLAFVFRHWSFEEIDYRSQHGRLSVEAHGETLLEISCYGEFELYTGTTWKPVDVESFLEGNWVLEINKIFALQSQEKAIADQERRKAWVAEQAARFSVPAKVPRSRRNLAKALLTGAGFLAEVGKALAAIVMAVFSGLGTLIGSLLVIALAAGFVVGLIWVIKWLWVHLPT